MSVSVWYIAEARPSDAIVWFLLGLIPYILGVIAVGTWAGSARSAYIRQYSGTRGVRLPAGSLEEALHAFESWGKTKWQDQLFHSKQRMLSVHVWAALHEPQTDPALERLRRVALRRSILFRAYIVLSAAAFDLLLAISWGMRSRNVGSATEGLELPRFRDRRMPGDRGSGNHPSPFTPRATAMKLRTYARIVRVGRDAGASTWRTPRVTFRLSSRQN